MKNILVASWHYLCPYKIYQIPNSIFAEIFDREGQNIQFWERLVSKLGAVRCEELEAEFNANCISRRHVTGIQGVLLVGMEEAIASFPTLRNCDLEPFGRPYRNAAQPGSHKDPNGHKMLNFMCIDEGGVGFDIFAMPATDFGAVFGSNRNVVIASDWEGIEEQDEQLQHVDECLGNAWRHPVCRESVEGVDGLIFYHFPEKAGLYPNRTMSDLDGRENPSFSEMSRKVGG
ncbi:hypothetical protein [Pseudokordiimonas caeni]|uniref:hypothetical protein n=1 Tax=Pseudokordiimonas caeni TaxID=2997908 RepID=UPI002810E5C1|nr:hypothetical protein [Pseudokordiimonas caeni]